jgi:hypothetical protein
VIRGEKVSVLKATLEHFMPQAQRLSNTEENIYAACNVCNGAKSSFPFDTVHAAKAWLQKEWNRLGWTDAPLLVPFKRTLPLCYN